MSQHNLNQPGRDNLTEVSYGWDVIGSDGEKIGDVAAIQPHYISVEKGFLFKTDIFVPTSAIVSVENKKVYLNVTKDQIENQDWDREPEMTDRHREVADYNEQARTADMDSGVSREAGDRMHIPLSEEHLDVTKRDVERGQVRVHKSVVEEDQVVNVPLREEEVRVERHDATTGHASGQVPDDAFQEQDIEIPLRGEEAEVHKTARVREEVDISKGTRERDEQVRDSVRREELHVDKDDDVKVERERP
jgi:uncharacterized protein (TIGR02271 family)